MTHEPAASTPADEPAARKARPSGRPDGDDVLDAHDSRHVTVGSGVSSGVRWMGTGQVAGQIVRIAMMLVLTRLLTPAEFGIVALVTVVTGFFERVLGDTGTTAAVVREPTLDQGLASSVFWWNLTIGVATSAGFIALGAPIARILGEPSAANLVRVVGLMALVNAFGHVQRALLRRRLQFRSLAMVNFTNALGTAVATIGLAVAGWGEWALVVGGLIGTFVSVALAWVVSSWRPSLIFARERLRRISTFSTNLSLQNLFGYISFAGDRFIIGRFIGTTELGYYGLANRLLRYPLQTSMQTYREVVFPTLARIQDDDRAVLRAYVRTVSGIAFLLLPFCLTLTAVAGPMVPALLGAEWVPATDVVAIMALVGALQSLAITTGSIYLAKARTDLSLRWQMFSSAVLMASYSIGAFWGVTGVAWGFLAGIALLTYPAFRIPLGLIGGRPADVARPIAPTLAASAAAAGGAFLTIQIVGRSGGGNWPQLLAGLGTAALVYGGYVLVVRPQAMRDLRSALARRRPKTH